MSLSSIFAALSASGFTRELVSTLSGADSGSHVSVRGASGSVPAFLCAHLHLKRHSSNGSADHGPVFALLPDADDAAYFCSDLQQILNEEDSVLLFPPSDNRPYDSEHVPDPAPIIERGDVLQRLKEGFNGILVSSIDAVFEKVPPRESVEESTFEIEVGSQVDPEEITGRLVQHGFERVEFVEEPGEIASRGGILDVFPFTGDYPVRIEFFGNEIDSIREFDIHTQRSVSRTNRTRIVPNLERSGTRSDGTLSKRTPIFSWLPESTLLFSGDGALFTERADEYFESAREHRAASSDETDLPDPAHYYMSADALERALLPFSSVHFGTFQPDASDLSVRAESRPQPSFNGRIAEIRRRIRSNHSNGMQTIILCDNHGQEGRLTELLIEDVEAGRAELRVESIHEGFELPDQSLAVYTDHQIFNRYHRPTARKQKQRYGGMSLRELHHLSPGDFVVHIDYGIGRFSGMEQIEVRGRKQEAVKVLYRDEDVLYVNVNALYKLHKYKGKEGFQPTLTKLGSGQWEKTKSKTKSRVKDIARDLIKLYARRKQSDGFAFTEDTVWQRELEAAFQFEDTPDQAATTDAVKSDMEEGVPMDRLVCGDVGFGKTEIAIRAAFKAVQDGKQVAVLVPTTVLAMQHHSTFSERLKNYPVRIDMLSRFRSSAQIRESLEAMKAGQVDIVVGTHRLVSKDVEFKDLGLLIVDEEQRFGVAVKEKLRKMRVDVDTLTLTATPIPRTLQFSLLGARDLSIIATAPPNRQSIETEIHTFDKDLIRDAILYETGRGGQVFFIHNRVQSIEEIASTVRMLVPDIRVRVAHGQMKGSDLEGVMVDFVDRKIDVLVSTSIIENGLDISNSNTIIINRADHFGLAELHQLRGRVGRSNRKAFCYLLVPSIHGLTREARQRLQAVEEFSDLGSGFQLAMRDLDIRGAGNMLGAEQSGFVQDVGFETYHKILDEAVEELRSEEFSDLFQDATAPKTTDTTVDLDADTFIPDDYVDNRVERLNLYRRISDAKDLESLETLREELTDRFGDAPPEVENLLKGVELKLLAEKLRLSRIVFKNERLFLGFPNQNEDAYFYEAVFQPLLQQLTLIDYKYVLKESKSGRLRAIIQDVPDLTTAEAILKPFTELDEAVAVPDDA